MNVYSFAQRDKCKKGPCILCVTFTITNHNRKIYHNRQHIYDKTNICYDDILVYFCKVYQTYLISYQNMYHYKGCRTRKVVDLLFMLSGHIMTITHRA